MQAFPPVSTLDREVYGDQSSTITEEHIKDNLDGLTVEEVTSLINSFPLKDIADLNHLAISLC